MYAINEFAGTLAPLFESRTKRMGHAVNLVCIYCAGFRSGRVHFNGGEKGKYFLGYFSYEILSPREKRDERRSSGLAIIFIVTRATVIVLYSSVGLARKADKKEDKDEGGENNGGNVVVGTLSLEHAAFNVTRIKRRWECSSFSFVPRNARNGDGDRWRIERSTTGIFISLVSFRNCEGIFIRL